MSFNSEFPEKDMIEDHQCNSNIVTIYTKNNPLWTNNSVVMMVCGQTEFSLTIFMQILDLLKHGLI